MNCDGSDSLGLSQAETSKGMVSRVTAEERGCGTTENKKSERDDFEETHLCHMSGDSA